MSHVIKSLECGCAVLDDGRRSLCPTCANPPAPKMLDQRVLELAEHFCLDRAPRRHGDAEELTEAIQQAIFDWFVMNPEPDTDPHPEALRGREAAGLLAEQQDAARRLKR